MEKRNTSTSFGDITPLQHPIYLQPNNKDTEEALSEIEVTAEVVEEVVVTHVVDIPVEVVEAVMVVHQFEIKMVPLLVGFSLEQLLMDHQKMC